MRSHTDKYILNNKIKNYEYIPLSPNKKVWSVEGGNTVISYNNIGLPGADVNISSESKYIFLLGNSFIEATTVPQYSTASSVFQKKLILNNLNYQVLNLGASGNDIFILWHRTQFFKRIFKPDKLIFVIESLERLKFYLNRHGKPLDFSISEEIGNKLESSTVIKIGNYLRENISFVNLIFESYLEIDDSNENSNSNSKTEKQKIPTETQVLLGDNDFIEKLDTCLAVFNSKYGSDFCVISILPDKDENLFLSEICSKHSITFSINDLIMKPENQHNNQGHLNEIGNKDLGEFLFETFKKSLKSNNE